MLAAATQQGLTAATWFWLLVPMNLIVVLSLLSFLAARKKNR